MSVRLLSSDSWISTERRAVSVYAWLLTARTSSPMRDALRETSSRSWRIIVRRESQAIASATTSVLQPVASFASSAGVTPRSTSAAASSGEDGTSCASSQLMSESSRSARSITSSFAVISVSASVVAPTRARKRSSSSVQAWLATWRRMGSTCAILSRSWSTERPIAIAGLFNSCASPAARTPRVAIRSRSMAPPSSLRVPSAASPISALGEEAMGELDGDRALADRRRDALHRLVAHVTGAEDAGHARLQEIRIAAQVPAANLATFDRQIGAGENEAVLVALENARHPVGTRLGADEREERCRLELPLLAATGDRDGTQAVVAVGRRDAGARHHREVRRRLDLIDEVLGHARA